MSWTFLKYHFIEWTHDFMNFLNGKNSQSCWVSILFLPPVEIWFEVINLEYNQHMKLHNIVDSTLLSTMLSFFASLNYCETTSSTMNSISKREYSLLKVSINCCFVRYSKDKVLFFCELTTTYLSIHSFQKCVLVLDLRHNSKFWSLISMSFFTIRKNLLIFQLTFYWWISYANVILKLKTCLGLKKLDIEHKFINSFNLRNSNALRMILWCLKNILHLRTYSTNLFCIWIRICFF
jgi:hypothetical protein